MPASDGLGPLFNARSCQDCHLRDGRGRAPDGPDDPRLSMILRLSVPGGPVPMQIGDWLPTGADPVLGAQLQDRAVPGHAAEGRIEVTWTEVPVTLGDGSVVSLRAPLWGVGGPARDAVAPGALLGPRVASPMIGLGLLEAIPAADILALADPDDADGDGISGRAQIVPSAEFGVPMLGRFGWKAGAPTVREQTAAALSADMGLSTWLFPDPWGDCTAAQAACREAPHGQDAAPEAGPEVDRESLELLTFYSRNLGVPARRSVDDPRVLRGKALFHALTCAACHVPAFVTHRLDGQPEQSLQPIRPYTDLLLHDMGPGLADNRPEGRAGGSEWRTPPLWGIGLSAQVAGHSQFLHDGRARNLIEAILWHGGEAQGARDGFAALEAADRAALLAFLESL
jgi:CxxC motif-containing protein (DUF1111 family)